MGILLYDRFIYRMGTKRMIGIDKTYGDPNSFAASIATLFLFFGV